MVGGKFGERLARCSRVLSCARGALQDQVVLQRGRVQRQAVTSHHGMPALLAQLVMG